MNNGRKTHGNITAFSVGCVILLVIIGVFAYKLTMLMSGESELQHCCDSGTLNVARTAIVTPELPLNDPSLKTQGNYNPPFVVGTSPITGRLLPYTDYFACIGAASPYDNSKGASLLNINRILAQAYIISDNAQVENTTTAITNAEDELMAAHAISYVLRNNLLTNAPSDLQSAFSNLGSSNPLNMLNDQGSALTFNKLSCSWTDFGGSSSVYFDKNTLSNAGYKNLALNSTSPLRPTLSYTPTAPFTPYYVKGYVPVPANGTDSVAFLVDRPQQTPSLVSLTSFEAGQTPPLGTLDSNGSLEPAQDLAYCPPNTFQVTTSATQNSSSSSGATSIPSSSAASSAASSTNTSAQPKGSTVVSSGSGTQSNITLSTLACAVIGAVSNGTVASVPAGYIKVQNWPAMPTPDNNVYDSANNDVFDDDAAWPYAIWISPPVQLASSTTCLFSANLDSLSEWFRWANSSSKTGAYGKDDNLDPLTAYGQSITQFGLTGVPSPRIKRADNGKSATVKELLALSGASNGQSPPNSWSFDASGFSLTSQSQVVDFLAFNQGTGDAQEKSLPGEWDRLVTKVGKGDFLINGGAMFPMFDQALDGTEPAYITAVVPEIAAQMDRRKIKSVEYSLFPDGCDIIAWAKLGIILDRAKYKYEDTFYMPAPAGQGLDDLQGFNFNYYRSGKLYIPNRFGISPYSSDPKAKYAYIQHHAVYSASESGKEVVSAQKYAVAGTPWQNLQDIASALNGPVPYNNRGAGSTNNGVCNLNGSGDHSPDMTQSQISTLLNAVWQRCQQIKPGCALSEVTNALNSSSLGLNQTGWLYLNQSTNTLTFANTLSYADTNLLPDDEANQAAWVVARTGYITLASYGGQTDSDLSANSLINTTVDGTKDAVRSDANFHKAAWKWTQGALQYQDEAVFHKCSGYHNMLGELDFVTDMRNINISPSGAMKDNGASIFLSWPN